MNFDRVFGLSIAWATLFTTSLWATPEFAREQNAQCSVCHSNIPMLNETGREFLRNGFRFSSDDPTSIHNMLKGKSDGSRHIPLALMLRQSYSSNNHKVSEKVKLYAGGTLTKNVSFFGVTQKVYNHQSNSNAPDYFEQKGSRAYFQVNMEGSKHVVRAGLLSPFTQFGNIEKSSADSGLKGGGNSQDHSQQSQQGYNKNSYRNYRQGGYTQGQGKGNGQGQGHGQGQSNAQGHGSGQGQGQGQGHGSGRQGHGNGQNRYKTPLQISSFAKFRGIEYSYLYDSKWLFLFSYGTPVDESNQNSQSGHNHNSGNIGNGNFGYYNSSQRQNNSNDRYQFISGVRYTTDSGYHIGLMYNKFSTKQENSFSLLLPIEKEFDKVIWNSTLVYKNNKIQDDYYGIENAISYALSENSYIRAIFNADRDENSDHNYGYALSYSGIYKSMVLFHITAARKDMAKGGDDDLVEASISLFF